MNNIQSLSAALATAFLTSATLSMPAVSAEFGIQPLSAGYQLAEAAPAKPAEGKCGANKGEEGKCGADKGHEGKCGADKGKEGKCGAEHKDAKPDGKVKEGKCGEGKCGANKKAP